MNLSRIPQSQENAINGIVKKWQVLERFLAVLDNIRDGMEHGKVTCNLRDEEIARLIGEIIALELGVGSTRKHATVLLGLS